MTANAASFYITGGTMPGDAHSYVSRSADQELQASLRAGEYCYILTSRQMGKSSLMVRVAKNLRAEGTAVVVIDLTAIGQNLTAEQWYDGLLGHAGRQLGLEDEVDDYWKTHVRLSPLERWTRALTEVVLPRCQGGLVIFVDEIDVVRSLPFSTDEFFAAIREFYNRRTSDSALGRLAFCLLGVASPSDLIRDTRLTPFNIGRRIELADFGEAEAAHLAAGLHPQPAKAARLLRRVLHWTGGHPYLTQRLCQAVAGLQDATEGGVDRECAKLFLSHRSQERDDNLLFVRERLLRGEADRAAVLDFYDRVRRQGRTSRVRDDEADPRVSHLRLAGVVRVVQGHLRIRNRIYGRVFDHTWVWTNMPGAERRRQRAAFRRGLLRASVAALVVILVLGALGALVWQKSNDLLKKNLETEKIKEALDEAQRARSDAEDAREREEAERKKAIAEKRQADIFGAAAAAKEALLLQDQGNVPFSLLALSKALEMSSADPEQAAVHKLRLAAALSQCPRLVQLLSVGMPVTHVEFSSDGKQLAVSSQRQVSVWSAITGERLAQLYTAAKDEKSEPVNAARDNVVPTAVRFEPRGRWLFGMVGGEPHVWDADTFRPRAAWRASDEGKGWFSPDGTRLLATDAEKKQAVLWDVETLQPLGSPVPAVHYATFDPEGKFLLTASGQSVQVLRAATGASAGKTLLTERPVEFAALSTDGELILTFYTGVVKIWNARDAKEKGKRDSHRSRIRWAGFCRDRHVVVTLEEDLRGRTQDFVGIDPVLLVWHKVGTDEKPGDVLHTVEYRTRVSCLTTQRAGRVLVTGDEDRTVRWVDLDLPFDQDKPRVRALQCDGHSSAISDISFSPDGRYILTGGNDGTARLWHGLTNIAPTDNYARDDYGIGAAPAPSAGHHVGHAPTVTCTAFSPDGRLILTAGADGTVRLWSLECGGRLHEAVARTRHPIKTECSEDGSRLVVVDEAGKVELVDLISDETIKLAMSDGDWVEDAWLSKDGKLLATRGSGGTRVWNCRTGEPICRLTNSTKLPSRCAFSHDGLFLVTISIGGEVIRWNARTGRQDALLQAGHSDSLVMPLMAAGPFGEVAVSTLEFVNDHVLVWTNGSSGSPHLMRLTPYDGPLSVLRFSPDGRYLVGIVGTTAYIWDLATGKMLRTLQHSDEIRCAAFSTDGKLLVTGGRGRMAEVWERRRSCSVH